MPHPTREDYLVSIRPCAIDSIPDGQATCSICQEDFGPECTPTKLSCGHYVGIDCIKTWLGEIDEYGVYRNKCPYNCQLYRRTDAGRSGRPSDVPIGPAYDSHIGGQVDALLERMFGAPVHGREDDGNTERRPHISELTRLRDLQLSELDDMYERLEREEGRSRGFYSRDSRVGTQTQRSPYLQRDSYPSSPVPRRAAPHYHHSPPLSRHGSADPVPSPRYPALSRGAPFRPSNGPSRVTGFRDIGGLGQDEQHGGEYHAHSSGGGHTGHEHEESPRSLFETGGYSLGGRSVGFSNFLDRLERSSRGRSRDEDNEEYWDNRRRRY